MVRKRRRLHRTQKAQNTNQKQSQRILKRRKVKTNKILFENTNKKILKKKFKTIQNKPSSSTLKNKYFVHDLYSSFQSHEQSSKHLRFQNHFNDIIKDFREISLLQQKSQSQVQKVQLNNSKKILVLDIDNTLLHSAFDSCNTDDKYEEQIFYDNQKFKRKVYFKKRPYLDQFLDKMKQKFELVIYTAASQDYAECAIKYIEKNEKIFSKILTRKDCICHKGKYFLKDLKTIGVDMQKIVLVDDLIISFGMNINNGIPIIPYLGEDGDDELIKLETFLDQLQLEENFQNIIQKYFKWNLFKKWWKNPYFILKNLAQLI